jgi:Tfp pilus assembly protein PilO
MNPKYSRYYTFIKPILDNKSVKNYSFLTFSIFTSIIFAVFAIQPTVKTIISLQKSINDQQEILKQADIKYKNILKGKANYNALSPQVQTNINTMVPNYPTLPILISDLYSLASVNEASISGLQFQPIELPQKITTSQVAKEVKTLDFTVNIHGSYTHLADFLDTLGKLNHLISIDSASFIKPADGTLFLTVNAKTYYLK